MRQAGQVGRRLRARVLTLVAMGLLAPMAVMAWAGAQLVGELERRVLSERVLLARVIAERLGGALTTELEALQAVASAPRFDPEDEDLGFERAALRHVYLQRHVLFDEVFFIDGQGRARLQEPPGGPPLEAARLLEQVRASGRPVVSDLTLEPNGGRRLYALVPVRARPGEVSGVVGAAIDPRGVHLAAFLKDALDMEEGEAIDVVDSRGRVIASTDDARLYAESDHARFLAGLIEQRRSTAGDCHGCHAGASARPMKEVLAFAPLSIAHWGVSVRQPKAAVYAFVSTLERHVLLSGAALLAVALLFALGATLSVTRPLATLTEAAERLAAGELTRPIPELAHDEVGRLGGALERMRVALKDSIENVERANAALEGRVKERTGELERLNGALREREEARARALRKVISAQEDERKRVARELHDQTSQSLAALAMGLEAAARGLDHPAERRRVEEAAQLAVHTLGEVHRIIVDLRPSVLDDLGLSSAIRWYAERALGARGVSVRCEFSGLEGRLPLEVETALFRLAQESLTNIARHAKAETVLVQCALREGWVSMEIEDDGRGFDVAAAGRPDDKGRGLGLLGMRERVELLGGTLSIESAPGEGTRVALRVPLPAAPQAVAHG